MTYEDFKSIRVHEILTSELIVNIIPETNGVKFYIQSKRKMYNK